jgi:hypothetical protein
MRVRSGRLSGMRRRLLVFSELVIGLSVGALVARIYAPDPRTEAAEPGADGVPAVIMIWGDTLRGRVYLTKSDENERIVESLVEPADVESSSLRTRPFFEVAFFIVPADRIDAGDASRLARLAPADAAVRGRLYPPVDGLETVFVYSTSPDAGMSPIRRVGVPGLGVFRSYGIALRSVE